MNDLVYSAIERVLKELMQGIDPSLTDESGAGKFWDLSRELVHHFQAEIGEPMEASDLVYYSLYAVTEELMKGFVSLMTEVGLLEPEGDDIQ